MNDMNSNSDMESNDVVTFPTATPEVKIEDTNDVVVMSAPVNPVQEIQETKEETKTEIVETVTPSSVVETGIVNEVKSEPAVEVKKEEVPVKEPEVKEEPTPAGNNESDEKTPRKHFSFTVLSILILVGIAICIYYYVLITPERVFNKTIDKMMSGLENVVNCMETSKNETMSVKTKSLITTKGDKTSNDEYVSFIDGTTVNFDIDADLKNYNMGLNLVSKNNDKEGLTLNANYLDGNIYLNLGNKLVKYSDNNKDDKTVSVDKKRLEAFYVLTNVKNQITDIITEDNLERKILTKTINGQTSLAVKVTCELDNEKIKEIFEKVLTTSLSDKELMNKLSSVLGISMVDLGKILEGLKYKEIKNNSIKVDLYINLAGTELICLEVTYNNNYFEVSNNNGLYTLIYKVTEGEKEKTNILLKIDTYGNKVDGNGFLDSDTNYLKFDVNYQRKENEESQLIGNELIIKLYDSADKLPYVIMESELSIEKNNKLTFDDPTKSVAMTALSPEELKVLSGVSEKLVYEYYYFMGKITANKIDSQLLEGNAKIKLEEYKAEQTKKMMELYLKAAK